MAILAFAAILSSFLRGGISLGTVPSNLWNNLNWQQVLENLDQRNETKCDLQLQAFVDGLANFNSLWAIRMLDAWGKLPPGVLEGNLVEMGNYDQCRGISYDTQQEAVGVIQGRYCSVSIPFGLNIKRSFDMDALAGRAAQPTTSSTGFTIGSCFPDTCEAVHLEALLKTAIGSVLPVEGLKLSCEKPIPPMGAKEIAAIVIFSLVAVLVILSTIYEIVALRTSREPNRSLAMGSLYSNGINLLKMSIGSKTAAGAKSSTIECLNGIRVISMVWVVFCHNYLMLLSAPNSNPTAMLDWIKSYHSVLVISGTVSVDSFFLLSGMLICWSMLKELDKNRYLNLPLMYFHRYLRLTPALAAVVLFTATLMKYIGSGPLWNSSMTMQEVACDNYWWSALLYVQNYVNPKKICIGHSWYLSVDMQLYILSPLIIYPLWRWGRKILIAVVCLVLLSMGCVIATFLVNDLRLAFMGGASSDRMKLTYFPTHTRMGAWLIGVILGYILHHTKNRRVLLPKAIVAFGWLISVGILLLVLFTNHPLQQPGSYAEISVAVNAIYESFSRVTWACALGWIVFACVNGYGGPINTFLSLPVWQPLGRLSYSIYLLHFQLQIMLAGSRRNTAHFGDIEAVHNFWGDFGLTVTLAVLWSLVFESPIVGLEKLLFGSARTPASKEQLVVKESREDLSSSSVTNKTDLA
ncbi:nose resistant to fluoxetine protein 6-like [Toxorhynchites rutilus septentrionalis]|uniref:nose resistant to fluoxetine protein 6-like n=1 Tax=Toxorhynchites rutilus septentrionalis TaxID=329112 RepID=UPI00247A1C15|nr:nose resistant to fluoxetine protein 6-like [Toxorhynchites rutilus septentrionalis]